MADQGKWFKLWVSARRDSDLANLSKEDFTNWCLLGTYLKENGSEGMTCLARPAIALQRHMELSSYEDLINVLKKFPNCVIEEKQNSTVTGVTILNVTWKNWHKYQGDMSSERTRKWRDRVTAKKRREEKREEEKENKKRETPSAPDSRVKVLNEVFYQGLTTRVGERPIHNFGEAGKALKVLLATFSELDIQARMADWFKSNDPFVVKVSWRFSEFHKNFNKLKEGPIHANTSKPANAFVATGSESAKYDRK